MEKKKKKKDKKKKKKKNEDEKYLIKNTNFILTDDWVSYLNILKNGKLVICLNNGEIKIYNNNNYYKYELFIKEHNKRVNYFLEIKENYIITCSSDKTMKILFLDFSEKEKKYKIEQIIIEHNNNILKVIKINKNKFISLSSDNTFKIWNLNKTNKLYYNETTVIYQESYSYSNMLKINDNEIIISNQTEENLKIYELINYKIKYIFHNIKTTWTINNMCLIEKNKLIVGGKDLGGYYFINLDNKNINLIVNGLKWIYSIFLCNDNSIIMGGRNHLLIDYIYKFYFNDKIKNIQKIEFAHDDNIINIIQLNNSTFISSGIDKKIKFWK